MTKTPECRNAVNRVSAMSFGFLNLFLFFYSCTRDIGEWPVPPVIQPCDTVLYTYNKDIKQILNANCAITGCHDAATKLNGVDQSSYEGAKNAAQGIGTTTGGNTLCKIKWTCGVTMPYGMPQLPDTTIAKIERWINSGMCE